MTCARATRGYCGLIADGVLTASELPDHIEGLSPDIRACVLLDAAGRLAGVDSAHEDVGEELAERARELLEGAGTPQVEVSTPGGSVYAMRRGDWALAVVAGRYALSSLVFFDLREALAELAR